VTEIIAAIYVIAVISASCSNSIVAVIPDIAALSTVYNRSVGTPGSTVVYTVIISAG
jgi:hypothetical protein